MAKTQKSVFREIAHWLFYFFMFSVFGWIFETTVTTVLDRQFSLRGVLFVSHFDGFSLPWGLPAIAVYGWGGLLIYATYKYISQRESRFWKNPITLFFVITIAITLLELITSYITQGIWDANYWYYSWPGNFQGRISVLSSFVFGLLATLAILYLFPKTEKFFEERVNKNWHYAVIVVLVVYILTCLLLREYLFPWVYSYPIVG